MTLVHKSRFCDLLSTTSREVNQASVVHLGSADRVKALVEFG